ncbi:hypothetical protein PR048_022113 [Dryococelus australis]|uniref:Uncharacterized protein n=1 Tax=Dryococelus australis TaxID=614101 RepID=A0ABQ9H0B2_9NEOP|nr:hypothetical protein PR048_022113 [Dryococelus australis]
MDCKHISDEPWAQCRGNRRGLRPPGIAASSCESRSLSLSLSLSSCDCVLLLPFTPPPNHNCPYSRGLSGRPRRYVVFILERIPRSAAVQRLAIHASTLPRVWSSAVNKGRGKWETPEKTCRPSASSGKIPTCKNPVTRPGIEPVSPRWEASRLTAQPFLPRGSSVRTRVPVAVWRLRSTVDLCSSSRWYCAGTICRKVSPSVRSLQSGWIADPLASEERMEQQRNAMTGETGNPRENPPTSGIVRHYSHMRNSGSGPAGNLAGSLRWEASSLTTEPPRPPLLCINTTNTSHSVADASLLPASGGVNFQFPPSTEVLCPVGKIIGSRAPDLHGKRTENDPRRSNDAILRG